MGVEILCFNGCKLTLTGFDSVIVAVVVQREEIQFDRGARASTKSTICTNLGAIAFAKDKTHSTENVYVPTLSSCASPVLTSFAAPRYLRRSHLIPEVRLFLPV